MKTKLNLVLCGLMLVGALGGSNAEASDIFQMHREHMQRALSANVVVFAAGNTGKKVGGGQCTHLVEAALAAVGAFPGSNYVWGKNVTGEGLQPGDIIQFEGCRFETANSWFEMPHHTAIIASASGSTVQLLHQNFGSQTVVATSLDLSSKKKGYFTIYRPIFNF